MLVELVELAEPEPPGPPQLDEAGGLQDISPPTPSLVIATAPVSEVPVADFVVSLESDTSDMLSESQLAGAVSAGGGDGGGGGGGCNTARSLQQALQRDPRVRRAVEDAARVGKAVMLWDGDWVRSGAQDGKGLAVVREAVMWELAFAPEACRNMPMRGLVLLSLADGNTRFAIGAGDWRWSDLLGLHERPPTR